MGRTRESDYDECCAKVVLETFFPQCYQKLELSDKPDLRDTIHNVGIEVTSSIPQKQREVISLGCEISKGNCNNPEKAIKRIEQLGSRYTEYGISHPAMTYQLNKLQGSPYENILHSVEDKIHKLNSAGYEQMNTYSLFINTECFFEEPLLSLLLQEIYSINSKERKFASLVLQMLDYIVKIDLERHAFIKISIGDRLWGLGEKAMKIKRGEGR